MSSNETELFKDKIEVSLDGRQVFYLFFGGAVIATLVFVLGVMVGRRVEARAVVASGSPVTDPLAALDRLESTGELAFPSDLRGDHVVLGAVDETLARRAEREAHAAPELAVGGPGQVVEAGKDQAKSEKEEAKREAREAADRQAAERKAAKQAAAEALEAGADSEAPEAVSPDPEVAPKAKLGKRRFTLQVGSFQDKEEADSFFRQLDSSTYDPYMVEADVPGKGKYYRVRVGGYSSFDEAVAAKTAFEDHQHVIAYVTRLK